MFCISTLRYILVASSVVTANGTPYLGVVVKYLPFQGYCPKELQLQNQPNKAFIAIDSIDAFQIRKDSVGKFHKDFPFFRHMKPM